MKNQLYIVLIAVLLFAGCQGQTGKSSNIQTLAPQEFAAKFQSTPNAQLLDVRTADEHQQQNIDGFTNIDWNASDFETKVGALDKSKPVFLHCRSGGRSAKAAAKLQEMGFREIYDMDGGMLKWEKEGLPSNQ